jgi:hypothetical protein
VQVQVQVQVQVEVHMNFVGFFARSLLQAGLTLEYPGVSNTHRYRLDAAKAATLSRSSDR